MNRLPVPIIGAGGGGGKGGGSSSQRSPVEAPDSLRSTQYARVINLLCEGEIEGIVGGATGIYVDDTPLANPDGSWNFQGAGIQIRHGTPDQSPVEGFTSSESESTVGVTVLQQQPVVRSVTNPNMTSFRITLGFPQMTEQNTENGDLTGSTVTLAIDLQVNGGGFQQIFVDNVTGKTTSRYQRSYKIILARFGPIGATYDFRVRRITPDSASGYIQNAFQWETMTECVDSTLTYPYSAICAVQVDAANFKQIPKLSFDARLRRVQIPTNYDPGSRTYAGMWDGTFKIAWTDNPAWVLYDLATTGRFGLGEYLTPLMVDKWSLYAIAQYCDGMVPNGFGGQEPRYTCNCYIQTRSEAISLLQQIASIFNAMLFWSGGMLTVSADMPADPVMTFNPSNVIDGEFSYVGTPLNRRHTCALVTWNNPAQRFEQSQEFVEDPESINLWGVRELEIAALGCTSRGQAHRIGRWALLTEQLLSETINFKTGINAAFTRPGDIFTTTDPARAGYRAGGRIISANDRVIQVDAPVMLQPGLGYTLSVLLPDGTFQTRPVQVGVLGETSTFNVSPPFSQVPRPMAVWSLSSSVAYNEQWRCLSVTEDEQGNVEISGVAYRADKFAAIEHNLRLDPIPTGVLDPFAIGTPTELRAVESLFLIQPALVGSMVTFSWLAPIGAVRFIVMYQHDTDSPVYNDVFMSSIDVQPTTPGRWTFTVWAINALGYQSLPATISVELFALNQPPEDVQDFQMDVYNDSGNLTWRPASNVDVLVGGQTIIRYSTQISTNVTWEEASEIARFAGGQSNGFVPLMKGAYLAKFMNSSGNLSNNAAIIISTTGPLRDYNVVATLAQNPYFNGAKVNMVARYEILYLDQDEDRFVVSLTGGYYFETLIDVGAVYTMRCQSYLDGAMFDVFDDVDTWPDWDARIDVDGTRIDEGGGVIMISMTNVDPATSKPEDWSGWQRLVVSDLTFRAARFALQVNVPQTIYNIGITDLGVTVDVPDRMESLNNQVIPVGGTHIDFNVPFKDTPAITIIAQGLSTGDQWSITNQTTHGFNIAFTNSVGAGVQRTCDWMARGYGYEHVELSGIGYSALTRMGNSRLAAIRARTGPKLLKGIDK